MTWRPLESELGVPVVPLNARNGSGVAALKIVMAERLAAPPVRFWKPEENLLPLVRQIRYYFNLRNDYLALHYAQQYRRIGFLSPDDKAHIQELTQQYAFDATAQQATETIGRYARINEILLEAVTVTRTERARARQQPHRPDSDAPRLRLPHLPGHPVSAVPGHFRLGPVPDGLD